MRDILPFLTLLGLYLIQAAVIPGMRRPFCWLFKHRWRGWDAFTYRCDTCGKKDFSVFRGSTGARY